MGIDNGCSVGIPVTVFHQNLACIFLVPEAFPRGSIGIGNKRPIIQDSRRSPHIADRIAARFFTRLTQLINLFTDKRRHIVHVVGRMGKSGVNGQQQMLFQHSLNDIFRRTNHIKILMPLFDLRQHDLVDIKCLINDADIFACLFFIVCLKVFEYPLAYIICPVIDLKNSLPWFAGIVTTAQRTGQDQ